MGIFCFPASLKDQEEHLPSIQRKASILQGPVSQIIKPQKLEKPSIELIIHLLSTQVREALSKQENNEDLWPTSDVSATIEFMENSALFFDLMSSQNLDENSQNLMMKIATYMRNVAIPSGVLVKTTGQGIIQTCNATLKLSQILSEKIGISPLETKRLQKSFNWTHLVEHCVTKEKSSR